MSEKLNLLFNGRKLNCSHWIVNYHFFLLVKQSSILNLYIYVQYQLTKTNK